MDTIVYVKGMECKVVYSGWKVKQWESAASGQRELLIYPRKLLVPLHSSGEQGPSNYAAYEGPDIDLDEIQRKAERSAAKAAARARKNCRHKIKHAGFKQLLTLTYKKNMTDLDWCRRDFAAWLRIMRRLIPGFRAVYGFERQKRGAWHVHVACDALPVLMHYKGSKVKSWKVGTAVWRGIVREGGLCFVGGRSGGHNRHQSAGRIAGYISKYLTKENADGESGRRMWDSTRELTPPAAVTFDLPDMSMADAIALAFQLLPGESILKHVLNKRGDLWFLHTEPAG
jgi:hypothetical protein